MEKEFFWKDLSGRGFTNTFTLEELKLAFPEDEPQDDDEDDRSVHVWADNAEVGDEWNGDDGEPNFIIRTK